MATKEQVIIGVQHEISLFISRRAEKIESEISSFLNINPFLMAAIGDAHDIQGLQSLSNYLLAAHLATGHATSFGKMVDERILPGIFGTDKVNALYRRNHHLGDAIYDDIDHLVHHHDGNEYWLSLKAGAWTIQHGQAMQLYHNFKELGDRNLQKSGVVVGVFYGNASLLTNKYDVLRGVNARHEDQLQELEYVSVLAGRDFWAWINQGEVDTQDWVMEGIVTGSRAYLEAHAEVAELFRNAPLKLIEELREKYNLAPGDDLDWYALLHAVNNPVVEDGE